MVNGFIYKVVNKLLTGIDNDLIVIYKGCINLLTTR